MKPSNRQQSLPGFSTADEPTAEQHVPEVGHPASSKTEDSAAIPFTPDADVEESITTQGEVAEAGEPSFAGKKVFVVDSHSLIYQVFHAMPEMTSPSGEPVGAVQGFIRDVCDLIEQRRADGIICAFDYPGDNFRHTLYTEYKIHRQEMPADLQMQIPVIQEILKAMAIPMLSIPGYEADDVLATLARQIEEAGGECLIVTADKDCRQLITDRVKIYHIRKNEIFDAVALQAVWGIRPDQVVDFQTLVGDSVDNVPGIPLIGPKLAQELLSKYDTLENVFAHAHEMSGTKRRENLINGREQAIISRQLVKLDAHVPIEVEWKDVVVGGWDRDRVLTLCKACGFRQLATRLENLMEKGIQAGGSLRRKPAAKSKSSASAGGDSGAAFGEDVPSEDTLGESFLEAPWDAIYESILTVEKLEAIVKEIHEVGHVVVDTETTSVAPRWAEVVGISLCCQPGKAYYIPVRAPAGEPTLPWDDVVKTLKPVLEDATVRKVGQNIKYDQIVLRSHGINLAGVAFDTMVADYLLDPGQRAHNLDELAKRHLRHSNITIESLIGTGKNQKRMDEVPLAQIVPYAAEDADVPLRLEQILAPRLKEVGLDSLFQEIEMPLVEVLAEMESNGIRVDCARLQQLSAVFAEEIDRLEKEIYALAEGEFNIDSRLQLAALLFEKFNLPVLKKTKTGPSMDAEVLEELAKLHPLPAKVIEYRQNTKLKSTYVDALQELIHPVTGRVHTSFKQDVAATGRLSSQDPNLQNIPVRTDAGRAIRSAFLPGETGWLLMTADYSQIELRVLAHFSGDAALRQAFVDDRDIHSQVASEVYGVPLAEVTSAMRRSAKAINFGVIYGQSAFGLAKSLDIPKDEAAKFINAYFAGYPGIDTFMEGVLVGARKDGFVSTISGRRRPVTGVRDPATLSDKRQRNLPERIAINTVIQGSAADIIKKAMIGVLSRMRKEGLRARLLLQIHDELVCECPPEESQALANLLREEMSSAAELAVPLKIDVKTGENWAACEPV